MAGRGGRWARQWQALGLRTEPLTQEEEAARLEQQRRAREARLSRVRRLMEPPGPPERTLSRLAMEQMRCLRLESPEEWPFSRLARSFEVSVDVVGRVLRSRFSPSPERALKQDSRLPARPGHFLPAPPSRVETTALLPLEAAAAGRKRAGRGAPPLLASGTSPPHRRGTQQRTQEQQQQQQRRVVQKGREVVDEKGDLLYRIPD